MKKIEGKINRQICIYEVQDINAYNNDRTLAQSIALLRDQILHLSERIKVIDDTILNIVVEMKGQQLNKTKKEVEGQCYSKERRRYGCHSEK